MPKPIAMADIQTYVDDEGLTVMKIGYEDVVRLFKPKLKQDDCECDQPLLYEDKIIKGPDKGKTTATPHEIPSTGMDVPYNKRGGEGTQGCECGYEVGSGFPRWAYEHWHCGRCGGITQYG